MSIWKGIKLNSANARGFLFFLLLTAILATLIKMSKTYDVRRDLLIEVVDVPLDRAVHTIRPRGIEVNAQVSGFSILRSSFENPSLAISYSDLLETGAGTFEYLTDDHRPSLQKVLAKDATIINIKPKRVEVILDSLSSKRVPVIPRIDIKYSLGYGAASAVRVKPDSVTVVGPSEQLKNITLIQTQILEREEASQDINDVVGFDIGTLAEKLKFSETQVVVSQSITKFTEGSVTVPITVLNDLEKKVKILPKNVRVVYKVALDSFDRVGASDFYVTCDYDKANRGIDYLSLKIERQPLMIKGARLSTKQVKFIVVN